MTKTIARCGARLFSSQICPGHSSMNAPLRVKTPQRFSDNAAACPQWAIIYTARPALMLVLVSLHLYYMIIYLYQYKCIQPRNIHLILSRLPAVFCLELFFWTQAPQATCSNFRVDLLSKSLNITTYRLSNMDNAVELGSSILSSSISERLPIVRESFFQKMYSSMDLLKRHICGISKVSLKKRNSDMVSQF